MKNFLQKFLIIVIFRAFCKFARYNKRKLFDRITPLQELNLVYYKKKDFLHPVGWLIINLYRGSNSLLTMVYLQATL